MDQGIIDFAAEGLLDGLEGSERAERLALLEQLAADGVPLSELRRATANGTLMFLPADRVIVGSDRYTSVQIAELAGVELDFLVRVRRAMGLPIPEPDEAVYTDAELEASRMIHIARDAGITDEEMLDLMRVLGRGLSQAAESLRALAAQTRARAGHQRARAGAAATRGRGGSCTRCVDPLISSLLALHLRHATQSEVISAMERSGGQLPGSREVAVCFADLVGFTRLGEEVPPDELGRLAVRLEALAGRCRRAARAPRQDDRRRGDARLAPSPSRCSSATLDLIEAADAEGEDFPQLRAGAALGQALPRAGDWFGRPVNLASRITSVARPGSLLAERELRESARDAYRWSFAGERRLRGIREPVALYRVRRVVPA